MQNNKLITWLILAAIVIGFIPGWFTRPAGSKTTCQTVKIHDTLKTSAVSYKILPGVNYNIDSLTNSINQFWKDSLKSVYGKGLFQAKYLKEDELGKREYTISSRIPLDPESQLIVDEDIRCPKRTLGLFVGLNTLAGNMGLKYYILDGRRFSLMGFMSGEYLIDKKLWCSKAGIELEYRF